MAVPSVPVYVRPGLWRRLLGQRAPLTTGVGQRAPLITGVALAGAAALLGFSGDLMAQPPTAPTVPYDTTLVLGEDAYGRFHTLLEKTLFKVDVLTVDICVGDGSAGRIREALESSSQDDLTAVAEIALEAPHVLVRMRFVRDVGLDRFLKGIREDQEKAVKEGLLADSTFSAIQAVLPQWYRFLEGRGVRTGDEVHHRVFPGGVRSLYVTPEGEVLMDRVSLGEERRRSVIGTYFAPGGSFRDSLVRSVPDAPAAGCK